MVLVENGAIGDGPEDNPVIQDENFTESEANFTTHYTVYLPEWIIPLILGGTLTLALCISYKIFKKRKSEKFDGDEIGG